MSADEPKLIRSHGTRAALKKRWLALWPVTFALILYPVNNSILRITVFGCLLLLWIGLLGFYWNLRMLRWLTLGFPIAAAIFFILPGKPLESESLQSDYVDLLEQYRGTRYVWGGGNRLGIDCSGLVRSGLIRANFRLGVSSLNPALLRRAAWLWWHDCSARKLGEGGEALTRHLFDAESINQVNATELRPGDLAVTDDGVHVLAYLGGTRWIEADPDLRQVIVLSTPNTNVWFNSAVKLVRWRQLEEEHTPLSERAP